MQAGTQNRQICAQSPLRIRHRRARIVGRRASRLWGAILAAAGRPAQDVLISLLALNGLRVSEATSAGIEHRGLDRGHRILVITRKGCNVVTIQLAPRTARAIDLAVDERTDGRSSSPRTGGGWTGTAPSGSSGGSPVALGSPSTTGPA